jgi:hypothetical protein
MLTLPLYWQIQFNLSELLTAIDFAILSKDHQGDYTNHDCLAEKNGPVYESKAATAKPVAETADLLSIKDTIASEGRFVACTNDLLFLSSTPENLC